MGRDSSLRHQDKRQSIEWTRYSYFEASPTKETILSVINYTSDLPKWVKVVDELAVEANRICHFSQRQRNLDAASFVKLLVWGWFAQPQASLNQLAALGSHLHQLITPQAIDERLNSRAIMLLMQVLEGVLHRQVLVPLLTQQETGTIQWDLHYRQYAIKFAFRLKFLICGARKRGTSQSSTVSGLSQWFCEWIRVGSRAYT